MYSKDFYISEPVGNNAFSYDARPHKELYVPALKNIESLEEVRFHPYLSPTLSYEEREQAAKRVTLEEYDFEGNMQTCFGLENLYELNSLLNPLPFQGKGATKPKIYIVDNHNHVFYFWYLTRSLGVIRDNALLYHIDEHADTRDPWEYLLKPDSQDLQKAFDYTNFTLNVGNYIIPAEKEWLIWQTIQIRGESALQEYIKTPLSILSWEERWNHNIILNLDLDFFEPELDFIDYNLKKQVILDIAKKADLITICTSPYFINQQRALEVLRDLFDK